MPAIRRNGPRYLALCIIALAVVAASGMVAAQSLSFQGPDQGKAGETVKVDIVLDQAPGGISGYRISLSLKDRGLGEFREVEYPPWAGITENSPLSSPEVWIKAVDTRQGVEMNATGIVIATLSIYCFKDGPLAVEYGAVRIDDDEGNSLQGSAGLVIPTGDETVTPAPTPTSTAAAQGTSGTG
ncbi:MAG: hypothetical protein MUC66_04100, partial [Methanolinea sp.]|nr:hypothetical protein [Methanolinea sp.]